MKVNANAKTKSHPAKAAPAAAQDASEATGMDEVWIEGGRKLKGMVAVSGSKNATLPILTATLLAPGIYRFTNVPALRIFATCRRIFRASFCSPCSRFRDWGPSRSVRSSRF